MKVTRASWLLRTESDTRQLEASPRLIWGLLGAKIKDESDTGQLVIKDGK